MVSGPIMSWQIEGEKLEAVTEFLYLGSKITANGDCSHEIKRHLLLERKALPNLDSILKSRGITLLANVHVDKTVFPVVMYGCENWTIKKTDLLQNGLVGSLCSPRDSQESSPKPQFKSISSLVLSFLHSSTLTSIHDHWKNHSFD